MIRNSSGPGVSILLSVYNGSRDLPAVLASLTAQSYVDFEIVAVNDGSTDGSGEVLERLASREPRLRVHHQRNTGLGPALNVAASLARAPLLARQDVDDVSAPTRLERQLSLMDARQDVVLCGTWTWFVEPTDQITGAFEPPDDAVRLRRYLDNGSNPFVHGSIMMRKDAFHRAGGYRFRRDCEDYDLWLRLAELGSLAMVESPEYRYRLNPHGLSFGYAPSRAAVRDLCLLLRDERRAQGSESTSYQDALAAIYAQVAPDQPTAERATSVAYAQAIEALRGRRWTRYVAAIWRAARGAGPDAARARRHLPLLAAAPITRALYTRRVSGTAEECYRAVPTGLRLDRPSNARGV